MIMSSWFGDMTRAIEMYCERTSAAWDAEPLNAVSNAAFFIAAWAAWRLNERHPSANSAAQSGRSASSSPWSEQAA